MNKKILSTAGLGLSDSNRLKTYCSLMHDSLDDTWIIVDDFIESHVCFIHLDFLNNLGDQFTPKSQVTVLVDKSMENDAKFDYQINLPFTTSNVRKILNDISRKHAFNDLDQKQENEESKNSNFNFLFNIGKSIFGEKNKIDLNKARNSKTSKVITERLTTTVAENSQVLFLGSPRSGKSTAIDSVCQSNSLSLNLYVSDDISVLIDYGELQLDTKDLKLIGLPSKIRSDATWEIVSQQATLFIIMLDLSRPEPLTFLEFYLNFLNDKNVKSNIYCCFTHCDNYKGSLHQLVLDIKEKFLNLTGINHIDARKKEDVERLLRKVLN